MNKLRVVSSLRKPKRHKFFTILLICVFVAFNFLNACDGGGSDPSPTPSPTPSDDHGNTYSTATTISTDGTLYSGNIETAGDVDYFSFSATSGCTYVIETGDLGSGCDTYIYLYSTNGTTEIDHNNDGGEGLASRIEWEASSSGTYYIKVREYSSSDTGTYKISVTESCEPETSDIESETGTTTSDGHVVFTSDLLQREIDVQIEDQNGNPVSGMNVTYEANGEDLFIYVRDPNGEHYSTITDKYDVLSSSSSRTAIFRTQLDTSEQELVLEPRVAFITIFIVATIVLHIGGLVAMIVINTPGFKCFPYTTGYVKVEKEGDLDDIASDLWTLNYDVVRVCSDVSSELGIHDGGWFDASIPPTSLSTSQIKEVLLDLGLFENATYEYGYYKYLMTNEPVPEGLYIYSVGTTASPNFDVTGTWTGIWTNTVGDASGDLQFDLTMDSSGFLTGSITDVTNGITESLTSGHVEGDNIQFVMYDSASGDNLTFVGEISDENYMSGNWTAGAIREDYGTWEVSLTDGSDVGDSYEPDDTYSEASTISTNGSAQSHTIDPAGDLDWVKFYATSGNVYTIETSNLGDGCDTYIYLYSTDGTTEIAHNDDGGSGIASKIEWSCTSSGTYYVKIRHYNSSSGTGSYDISVSES